MLEQKPLDAMSVVRIPLMFLALAVSLLATMALAMALPILFIPLMGAGFAVGLIFAAWVARKIKPSGGVEKVILTRDTVTVVDRKGQQTSFENHDLERVAQNFGSTFHLIVKAPDGQTHRLPMDVEEETPEPGSGAGPDGEIQAIGPIVEIRALKLMVHEGRIHLGSASILSNEDPTFEPMEY